MSTWPRTLLSVASARSGCGSCRRADLLPDDGTAGPGAAGSGEPGGSGPRARVDPGPGGNPAPGGARPPRSPCRRRRPSAPPPVREACAAEVTPPSGRPSTCCSSSTCPPRWPRPWPGGTGSKWDLARAGDAGLHARPGSAGLNIGLQFFPVAGALLRRVCVGPLNPPGTHAAPVPARRA